MSNKPNDQISGTAESSSGPSSSTMESSSSRGAQKAKNKGKGKRPNRKAEQNANAQVRRKDRRPIVYTPMYRGQIDQAPEFRWEIDEKTDPIRLILSYFELLCYETWKGAEEVIKVHASYQFFKKFSTKAATLASSTFKQKIQRTKDVNEAALFIGGICEEAYCIWLHTVISGNELQFASDHFVEPDHMEFILYSPTYTIVFKAYGPTTNKYVFFTTTTLNWKEFHIHELDAESTRPPLESGGESSGTSDDGQAVTPQDCGDSSRSSSSDHSESAPEPGASADQGASEDPVLAQSPAVESVDAAAGFWNSPSQAFLARFSRDYPDLYVSATAVLPFWLQVPYWMQWIVIIITSCLPILDRLFLLQYMITTFRYIFKGPWFKVPYLPTYCNEFLYKWLYYSVTDYYETDDPTPENIFLDPKGRGDEAVHARYIAVLIDTARQEVPDVTNILRSFSANPRLPGLDFPQAICEHLTCAHLLDLKIQAADTWAKFVKKNQNLNVYVRLFYLILLFSQLLPTMWLVGEWAATAWTYILWPVVRVIGVNLVLWVVTTFFLCSQLVSSNYTFTDYPIGNHTGWAFEAYKSWAWAKTQPGWTHFEPFYEWAQTPGGEVMCQLFISAVIIAPLWEEWFKRLCAKFLSLSGLKVSSTFTGALFGIFESWAFGVLFIPMIAIPKILIHAWFGSMSYWKGVYWHASWNLFILSIVWHLTEDFSNWPPGGRSQSGVGSPIHGYLETGLMSLDWLVLIPIAILLWTVMKLCPTTKLDNYQRSDYTFKQYYRYPNPNAGIQILPVCVGDVQSPVAPWNKVKLATGCHKRGKPKGYFSVGLNLKSAVPFCYAGCHHNCNAAGIYRMAGTPKRYLPPYGNIKALDEVRRFWRQTLTPFCLSIAAVPSPLLVERGSIFEITKDSWYKRFTVKQAENLEREYVYGSRSLRFDMFVKKEKSMSYNPVYEPEWNMVDTATDGALQILTSTGSLKFHPRGISVPRSDVRVQFGPSSHRLQNYLKVTFSDRVLFASGLTRRQFSKWYDEVIHTPGHAYANVGDDLLFIDPDHAGGPIIESMDASRFDQHTIDEILECNALIYEKLGWHEEVAYSRATIEKVYKIRPGFGGAKGTIKVVGTQASGKWDTLGGNSLPMLGIARFCIQTKQYVRDVLFKAGYVCTGPKCGATELKADFLQNLPYPTSDDGIRFGPKIGRILSRTFWHDQPLSPDKCLPFALGVMIGMANDIQHIPILNDLFARLQEIVSKPWFAKKKNVHALTQSEFPAAEHPRTIHLLADRYQVDYQQLLSLRQYVRNWQPGTFLDDGHEHLMHVIVVEDCGV